MNNKRNKAVFEYKGKKISVDTNDKRGQAKEKWKEQATAKKG